MEGGTLTIGGIEHTSDVSLGGETMSATTLSSTTAGVKNVVVQTINGTSSSLTFTYYSPPIIISVFPDRGPTGGG